MRQKLEKELDRAVRRIVLLRDKNCITCSCGLDTWNATPGHFFKRRHRCTRWNLKNVNGQCVTCNTKDDDAVYRQAMIFIYGQAVVDDLEYRAHQSCKYSTTELKELLQYFKDYERINFG